MRLGSVSALWTGVALCLTFHLEVVGLGYVEEVIAFSDFEGVGIAVFVYECDFYSGDEGSVSVLARIVVVVDALFTRCWRGQVSVSLSRSRAELPP